MSAPGSTVSRREYHAALDRRDRREDELRARIAELEGRKSTTAEGLDGALAHTRVTLAVHDWIALDAPLPAKMNLTPAVVAKLVDRICGTVTTFHTVKKT